MKKVTLRCIVKGQLKSFGIVPPLYFGSQKLTITAAYCSFFSGIMSLDSSAIDAIREKQLDSAPGDTKLTLVITGHQEDPAAKATFFNVSASFTGSDGTEKTSEGRYRYSQLLDFNEQLIHDYGAIRLLRTFPPKKLIGNKEVDFVAQRMEALQNWMSELCADEETCQDKRLLAFFKLNE